jgi:hypothetical protein
MKVRGEYILEMLFLLTLYSVIIRCVSKMPEKIAEFPGLYTTRAYITVSISVLHHHLSSPIIIIITYLSFHRHLLWVCGGLSTTRVTCPARLNIYQTNTLMIFDQEYICCCWWWWWSGPGAKTPVALQPLGLLHTLFSRISHCRRQMSSRLTRRERTKQREVEL